MGYPGGTKTTLEIPDLHSETARLQQVNKNEFDQIEPEDWS
jgi:hypothetical protein